MGSEGCRQGAKSTGHPSSRRTQSLREHIVTACGSTLVRTFVRNV